MNENKFIAENWISHHFYYVGSYFNVLSIQLPEISNVLKKNKIHDFFFIRYHDKEGQHIRVRCLTNKSVSEFAKIYENIISFQSIKFIAYERETERYFGNNGMICSEKQFILCSKVIIKLSQLGNFTYERALLFSLCLHIIYLRTIKVSNEEKAALLNKIIEDWYPSAKDYMENSQNLQNLSKLDVYNHFTNTIENNGLLTEIVNELIRSTPIDFVNLLDQIDPSHNLSLFYHKMIEINLEIFDLFKNSERLIDLTRHYIHLTNNRLGVFNQDESFIAYFVLKYLNSVKE